MRGGINMCHKYEELMSLYIDELLTMEEKQELEQHIANCSNCAEKLKKLEMIVQRVQSEPQLELPENFHNEFMLRLKRETQKSKRNVINYRAYAGAVAGFILTLLCLNFLVGQIAELTHYQIFMRNETPVINEHSEHSTVSRGVSMGANVFSEVGDSPLDIIGDTIKDTIENTIEVIYFSDVENEHYTKIEGENISTALFITSLQVVSIFLTLISCFVGYIIFKRMNN